jgi:hypothetical protein
MASIVKIEALNHLFTGIVVPQRHCVTVAFES